MRRIPNPAFFTPILESAPPTGLLLDTYTGALFAYSVRLLRTAYSGSAIRVRRSSDNAEQDIGFDGSGNLDESSLTTFVGANNGFLVTWYDQSGNGNDITEATAADQNTIVTSGSVYKEGSIPAIKSYTGGYDGMSTGLTGETVKSIFAVSNVAQPVSAASQRVITSYAGSGSVANEVIIDRVHSTNTIRYFDGGSSVTVTSVTGALRQFAAIRTASTIALTVDAGTPSSTSVGANANANNYKLFEEGGSSTNEVPTSISELIFYDSDKTANKAAISLDQKTYFGTP